MGAWQIEGVQQETKEDLTLSGDVAYTCWPRMLVVVGGFWLCAVMIDL